MEKEQERGNESLQSLFRKTERGDIESKSEKILPVSSLKKLKTSWMIFT